MNTRLGRVVILVDDFDRALEFYQQNFFCQKIYDETLPGGQRFLHISFSDNDQVGIWFLKAETPNQHSRVGHQTGGQPMIVIYTDYIDGLYDHVQQNGVQIIEELTQVPGSKFFHCHDLYGNRLTVVQLLG